MLTRLQEVFICNRSLDNLGYYSTTQLAEQFKIEGFNIVEKDIKRCVLRRMNELCWIGLCRRTGVIDGEMTFALTDLGRSTDPCKVHLGYILVLKDNEYHDMPRRKSLKEKKQRSIQEESIIKRQIYKGEDIGYANLQNEDQDDLIPLIKRKQTEREKIKKIIRNFIS